MRRPRVPVIASSQAPWNRQAADAINRASGDIATLDGQTVKHDGTVIYAGATAGPSYDETQMQAVMDAVKAISDRLT